MGCHAAACEAATSSSPAFEGRRCWLAHPCTKLKQRENELVREPILQLGPRFHSAKDMDDAMSLSRFVEILPLGLMGAEFRVNLLIFPKKWVLVCLCVPKAARFQEEGRHQRIREPGLQQGSRLQPIHSNQKADAVDCCGGVVAVGFAPLFCRLGKQPSSNTASPPQVRHSEFFVRAIFPLALSPIIGSFVEHLTDMGRSDVTLRNFNVRVA